MASEEAEQKYQKFDFSTDLSWREFERNIFPVPSADKLDKIKRKWFRKNIDPSLPETISSTDEPAAPTNTDDNNSSQASQPSGSRSPSSPQKSIAVTIATKIINVLGGPAGKMFDVIYAAALPMKEKFFVIEGVLKFVFIPGVFLIPKLVNMIAFVVCMLGFLRQTGRPRYNLQYGQAAMYNEFLQNLLYMVPFAFFPNQKTLVYYLPLGIHFWIGFCEFVNLKLPTIYPKIAKFADFTRNNRALLMLQKAKLEIMLFVFLVIQLFFRGSNLIIIFFYGNFLKTKYLINPATQSAFKEINTWVENKTNSPSCPGIIKMIVNKVRGLCEYLVKR